MSTVRMCDLKRSPSCMGIFSELEEEWQTFTASTVRKNKESGRREAVTEQLDACPACAVMPVPSERELKKLSEGTEDEQREARIRRLERELGLSGERTTAQSPEAKVEELQS